MHQQEMQKILVTWFKEDLKSGAFVVPTRAVQFGGYGGPSVNNVNTIDYVTIQTMGNSIDFGDLKDGEN